LGRRSQIVQAIEIPRENCLEFFCFGAKRATGGIFDLGSRFFGRSAEMYLSLMTAQRWVAL
jgi:hypothetical protein